MVLVFDTYGLMKEDYLMTSLSELIKTRAKSLGITQTELSEQLGVSIATIKRWYSGKGLTLSAVESLAKCLSLSLTEIFSQVENTKITFTYTRKQETAFVKKPDILAFFDYLLKGKSVKEIESRFSIPSKKLTKILLELDKLELIELHENNKIKMLKSGEPVWSKGGVLSKQFKPEILNDFLGKVKEKNTSFSIHEYLVEDIPKIESKINELKDFLTYSNKRAQKSSKKESFGAYICIDKYNWDMDKYLYKV